MKCSARFEVRDILAGSQSSRTLFGVGCGSRIEKGLGSKAHGPAESGIRDPQNGSSKLTPGEFTLITRNCFPEIPDPSRVEPLCRHSRDWRVPQGHFTSCRNQVNALMGARPARSGAKAGSGDEQASRPAARRTTISQMSGQATAFSFGDRP
jgi:hypothetical protein